MAFEPQMMEKGIIDLRDNPNIGEAHVLPLTPPKVVPDRLGLLALDLSTIPESAVDVVEEGRWLESHGHYSVNTVMSIWTPEGLSLDALQVAVNNSALWAHYPPMVGPRH
jgi:hypothetical protein